jgi:dihydrofolate reductase
MRQGGGNMRKLIVFEHITLDGVIQSPGAPDEDRADGFALGGWAAPYADPALEESLVSRMKGPFDLLLGRKTFDIWAGYWPHHGDVWPGANRATKYVASTTLTSSDWGPSVFLNGHVPEKVARIKQDAGPDLHLWGSGCFVQTLLKHDLIDTLCLMIYPVTLGSGKRLFEEGTIPAAFGVTESRVGSSGVIFMNYERAGRVVTGTIGER